MKDGKFFSEAAVAKALNSKKLHIHTFNRRNLIRPAGAWAIDVTGLG